MVLEARYRSWYTSAQLWRVDQTPWKGLGAHTRTHTMRAGVNSEVSVSVLMQWGPGVGLDQECLLSDSTESENVVKSVDLNDVHFLHPVSKWSVTKLLLGTLFTALH